ncbi:MAG TPA: GNAT family N-acetyltransferase [Candidatus Binatus sp.]|nr:GNAT family N-acetyltransferase [Candidatus Binatus sp.]
MSSGAASPERPPALHSSRLTLEPINQAHASALLEHLQDARLFRYTPHWLPTTLDELRERFAIFETGRSFKGSKQFNWAARREDDHAYVGMAQVTFLEEGPMLGYLVFVPFWKMGFAKEAAAAVVGYLKDELRLPAVWTSVDAENVDSIKVLESLHFKRTAKLPSELVKDGTDYRYERQF